jgi:type II secretory pathway predicted ATPase ExeA
VSTKQVVKKLGQKQPVFDVEAEDYIAREEFETFLEDRITHKKQASYLVVHGEMGSGKSTTVRRVLSERTGVIHVALPSSVDEEMFLDIFCRAAGLDLDALKGETRAGTFTSCSVFPLIISHYSQV